MVSEKDDNGDIITDDEVLILVLVEDGLWPAVIGTPTKKEEKS